MSQEGKYNISIAINQYVLYRKLVGLRWWSVVLESGEEVWHFETIDQSKYTDNFINF
jgi:hypothetical protein